MTQQILLQQRHQDYIELIQLTDTHLFADTRKTFDDVDTAKSLQQVIKLARSTTWPPDAVLVTGDLVHETITEAYERLAEILRSLELPVFCIPGNHDDPELMQQNLDQENISTAKILAFEYWTILMLDSFLADTHAGCLNENELHFLETQLKKHKDKYILICLHHPPVSIQSPWMDNMALNNPDAFFNIVDQHSQVKGILWGHIHQEYEALHNQVRLMATPSTCVQFTPKTDAYIKDDLPPGYRRLRLHATGEIETEIIRVEVPHSP